MSEMQNNHPHVSQVCFGKAGHWWSTRQKARETGRYYATGTRAINNVYDCWSDEKICKVADLIDDREVNL